MTSVCDLIGSVQADELAYEGPSQADLDWFAHQAAHEPAEPVSGIVSFPEWIQCQAACLRSLGSDAGDWLAAKIDEVAGRARFLHATSPGQYEARDEALSTGRIDEALNRIRLVAQLLDSPCLAGELLRCADSLESILASRDSC